MAMTAPTAEAFPAGETLADELEARDWTQAEFADILGRPAQFVSEIIAGKKEITRESAAQIGAALGTSAELWLNLQDAYFLWKQAQDNHTQQSLNDVRLRARLKELAPIAVLRKHGFISSDTPHGQAKELMRLYKIKDIYADTEMLVATRRTKAQETLSSTQLAWIACVRHKAEGMRAAPYDPTKLKRLAESLTHRITSPADFLTLPAALAEAGVRLVYVEAFPSSKMDGCAFALDDGSPVIGISGRGKRLDKVLFTLLHELAHVILGHIDEQSYIIDDEERPTLGLEEPANRLAGLWVMPDSPLQLPDRITHGWIQTVARDLKVHPIVLVGRLQNQNRIPWRTTLVKDAPTVTNELERW
jgi:HTH-type transcriptional regulator/antitoxin HigA